MSVQSSLAEQRRLIRSLLAPSAPEDALSAYYALFHDARRTALTLHRSPTGRVGGFVAVCQTGQDLFVPLVVLRCAQTVVGDLLRRALVTGRPYRLITVPALREAVEAAMQVERAQINHIYILSDATLEREINVLVQSGQGPFRFEVRRDNRPIAAAGVNWQTDRLAELYVYVEPEFQRQGWGQAVAGATIDALVEARLLPLYTVAEENEASRRLARALGFADSGAREFEVVGRLCP
ncbi:MAG: GNAT family N-acetyltransferase [Anaerolineae bacterium]|nr:GNAT family N-acetyltransferase [Anaerolineae bacterium]